MKPLEHCLAHTNSSLILFYNLQKYPFSRLLSCVVIYTIKALPTSNEVICSELLPYHNSTLLFLAYIRPARTSASRNNGESPGRDTFFWWDGGHPMLLRIQGLFLAMLIHGAA